ncbi:hypothetical protein EJ02DRAFT_435071 [Clathrospora elynae]|uniref:Uncharacterized protein n=1 Tax=Clathrospora elynae TaxID=706981 RepID=A0A6A5SMV8_9PLEO|nr:hypothetical protein EJ02DRAFT_435071 [Clathrospora elynae]
MSTMEEWVEWVKGEFKEEYCDDGFNHTTPLNLDCLRTNLHKQCPDAARVITEALKILDLDICRALCKDLPQQNNKYESDEQLDDGTLESDFSLMDRLVADKGKTVGTDSTDRDIKHAPLLPSTVVAQHTKDLVPQFGFFGTLSEATTSESKIFQNTNVPFFAFVCGVQGSGKSYTTAIMLENALIQSRHLGRLKAPISALVFSYGY